MINLNDYIGEWLDLILFKSKKFSYFSLHAWWKNNIKKIVQQYDYLNHQIVPCRVGITLVFLKWDRLLIVLILQRAIKVIAFIIYNLHEFNQNCSYPALPGIYHLFSLPNQAGLSTHLHFCYCLWILGLNIILELWSLFPHSNTPTQNCFQWQCLRIYRLLSRNREYSCGL